MKKKIIATLTSLIMTVTLIPTLSFATEKTNETIESETNIVLEDAGAVATVVEDITGTSNIIEEVSETEQDFVLEGYSSEITIPEEGNGEIVFKSLGSNASNEISMELPNEFSNLAGELAGEGTVVYEKDNLDSALAVQGIQEQQGDIHVDGFRSLVTIKNADAPNEYSFKYNLPDGCKLITSEDYYGNDSDAGYIYIINENDILIDEESGEEFYEIIGSIAPAWAKDANGNAIRTSYKINGDTITQVIEFDENSVFPIIADPTTSKPASKMVDSGTTTVKVNLAELGGVSLFAAAGERGLTSAAKKKILNAAAKKVASKFVPVFGYISIATSAASYAAYKAGYKYLKITIHFEKWTYYKSQGGKWVKGYVYKNCSAKCSLTK